MIASLNWYIHVYKTEFSSNHVLESCKNSVCYTMIVFIKILLNRSCIKGGPNERKQTSLICCLSTCSGHGNRSTCTCSVCYATCHQKPLISLNLDNFEHHLESGWHNIDA